MGIRESQILQPAEVGIDARRLVESGELSGNSNRHESTGLVSVLDDICQMVQAGRRGLLCAIFAVRNAELSLAAAPNFEADIAGAYQSHQVEPRTLSGFGEVWSNMFECPLWRDRAGLVGQLGVESCMTCPVFSAGGEMVAVVGLHYRRGRLQSEGDRELLRSASHLVSLALESRVSPRHDILTGLPTRTDLIRHLSALIEANEGKFAVLSIGLDGLQKINDSLGHAAGDRLLQQASNRMRERLAPGDMAGRIEGGEFALIVNGADEVAAVRKAEALLRALRAPYGIDGVELFVTASIGIALSIQQRGAEELLRNAELAMYAVKRERPNSLEIFDPKRHAHTSERLQLENALHRAIDNDELELLYQPIVNMQGVVEGFESLLSWRNPIHGLVSPEQFIPMAEESGLITELGSWVLRRACREGAVWHSRGYRAARISVNVSARQFEKDSFLDEVAAALSISGLPPERLELELTESCVMRETERSMKRMAAVRELGVGIAIDDFGKGYSSLSYLSELPVDSLKIDRSFLRATADGARSLAVIQSIVQVAHSMGMAVVAEGIETPEQMELVGIIGCDLAQGRFWGAPLHASEAEELLSQTRQLAASTRNTQVEEMR